MCMCSGRVVNKICIRKRPILASITERRGDRQRLLNDIEMPVSKAHLGDMLRRILTMVLTTWREAALLLVLATRSSSTESAPEDTRVLLQPSDTYVISSARKIHTKNELK